MYINKGPQKLSEIFKDKNYLREKGGIKKPPAYEWQDLALRVIKELNIPNFKRNSVFKICKDNSKSYIEKCLNDTKELCHTGQKWKYFFKLINEV
ncbi:MAG: hypothetical protein ABIE43_01920 [Patescibacteria group bacterium]